MTPPLDFDHLSRTPTPLPNFQQMNGFLPDPPVTLAITVDARSLHSLQAQRRRTPAFSKRPDLRPILKNSR
jgi:hypothetical protein